MPTYVYKCPECRRVSYERHRMEYSTAVLCLVDGNPMYRVPQPFRVNWGELKPSDGGLDPTIRQHIDDLPRKRDEFEAIHAEHEKRTAGE